jgi:hypothetical protein
MIVIIIVLALALALALVFPRYKKARARATSFLRRRLATFVSGGTKLFSGGTKLFSGGTKLYHQTDVASAYNILQTQKMKPGNGGVAGGGIYFATTPELTGHKAHKHGVILEATVALGRIHTLEAAGDPKMTLQKLKAMGFDSVCIARPVSRGQEYVVYDPKQVRNIRQHAPGASPPPPAPCAAGCGFFGSADTGGMCSRCYSMRRSDEPLYQV